MTPRRKPLGGLGHYVLDADGKTPLLEEDFMAWAEWFEKSWPARRVARTDIGNVGYVSTIFLGLDHGWHQPRPVLFETMSFIGQSHEDYFDRYCTWDEALVGHHRIVRQALQLIEHTAVDVADLLTRIKAEPEK
jgi:hypothetical protein